MSKDFDQRFEKAGALHAAGEIVAASKIYAELLSEQPDNDIVQYYNALADFDLGHHTQAIDALKSIITRLPEISKIRLELAKMLEREGDYPAALMQFEKSLSLDPNDLESLVMSGHMYTQTNNLPDAINRYKKALGHLPSNHATRVALTRALMLQGDWGEADQHCMQVLQAVPGHTGAMALQSIICFELGRDADARQIMNFKDRLMPCTFEPDGGLDAMNLRLADAIANHPTIAYEPKDYSTKCGYHTGDITDDTSGPIFELLTWVRSEIDVIIAECQANAKDPFSKRAPASYSLNAWGVVMEDQGHQDSHIHRDAWLSGVYYIQVPPSVQHDDPESAGWIEFGTPHDYPERKTVSETRLIMPETGNAILFPAYFYHRTIPLRSSDTRICIAFDAIPQ